MLLDAWQCVVLWPPLLAALMMAPPYLRRPADVQLRIGSV